MDFMLGNIPIHNARNIEWKSNGDGTGQLWFNSDGVAILTDY